MKSSCDKTFMLATSAATYVDTNSFTQACILQSALTSVPSVECGLSA
jgi:hypothetical protein